MASIQDLLKRAHTLEKQSETSRLDIEVLLSHVLGKTRSYLYAWPEYSLGSAQLEHFEHLFERRLMGEPVAYLTGKKEFWTLCLEVNPSTLIPRPETELVVEVALKLIEKPGASVLDLGTGTGAIALALASERPGWNILAVDNSPEAVELASRNRDHLKLDNVSVLESHWFSNIGNGKKFDLMVSNPPYVDAADCHLGQGDVRYEPHSALVAGNSGLADLQAIAERAPEFLADGAQLLLEHGSTQGKELRRTLKKHYADVTTWCDYSGLERVSGGGYRC